MTSSLQFNETFEALTGHSPFPWQRRLFKAYFRRGILPTTVDIPTGLGKTAIMAIWLIARAAGAPLPRRLVYVVDRRAVVDQATEFAEMLRKTLGENESLAQLRCALDLDRRPLPISTLRGRHADNREWMADPAAHAIIVGTVDMVGSRLLFEGYGLSRRMRPFAAALLGCDSLLMLDEAHLSRPFERLLRAIELGRYTPSTDGVGEGIGRFSGRAACSHFPPPFRLLPLSATLTPEFGETSFRLDEEDRAHQTVRMRLNARKYLTVEGLALGSSLDQTLAERARGLMQEKLETGREPPAVAIYCDRRKDAEKVATALRKQIVNTSPQPHVILFVGGRRVYERQKAADELQEHGLICSRDSARVTPVFLVATSAGEVGVDIDADHMVCDLVAWERMVQRLGRVNRLGKGRATVLVIDPTPPDERGRKKVDSKTIARYQEVRALFDALPHIEDHRRLAGPGALIALTADPAQRARITNATTPMPLYPALTRPLVDAWSMTSLEDHAGRPEITPWLRGWVEEDQPQTVLVWRRYLPLRLSVRGGEPEAAPKRELRAFFVAAPPQTTELLETETSRVVDWLRKRARKLLEQMKKAGTTSAASDAEADEETAKDLASLAPLTKETPFACLLDSANRPVGSLSLVEIDELKSKELHTILAGRQLVVDARIRGLTSGLLDDDANGQVPTIEDNWGTPDDGRDRNAWTLRVDACSDSEQVAERWRSVSVTPYKLTAEGDAVSWLVVRKRSGADENEDARAVARKAQSLDEHRQWAGEEAARIADALNLGIANKDMLVAAAYHHDDGKADSRWQRAFGAMREGAPYAKTTKAPNQHLLNGFRHELKSTLDAERNGLGSIDRADPRFDLGLHLIAAHHGSARPAIGVNGYDAQPPSTVEAGARRIALRFARMQREWGPWGLAWWEALLRAADQAASRRLDDQGS